LNGIKDDVLMIQGPIRRVSAFLPSSADIGRGGMYGRIGEIGFMSNFPSSIMYTLQNKKISEFRVTRCVF
jgi:hypothetical protein